MKSRATDPIQLIAWCRQHRLRAVGWRYGIVCVRAQWRGLSRLWTHANPCSIRRECICDNAKGGPDDPDRPIRNNVRSLRSIQRGFERRRADAVPLEHRAMSSRGDRTRFLALRQAGPLRHWKAAWYRRRQPPPACAAHQPSTPALGAMSNIGKLNVRIALRCVILSICSSVSTGARATAFPGASGH